MFTGIIEEIGAISRRSGGEMAILAEKVLDDIALGDSIAVDGACLTVAALLDNGLVANVSPETYARTTLGFKRPGDAVNLERAMRVDSRLGGHFVQGHVDSVGRVVSVQHQGEFSMWRFRASSDVAKYLTPKGSIAVDGISLTVVEPSGDTFDVAIIPSTLKNTTLHSKREGDMVNIEADMIGKHIYHYLHGMGGSVTMDTLKRHGFA